ncbi:hypothetical protein [Streptomyces sp. NPDC006274]|uniref:hypothetical protein n=1 Tax=unclassified Streptomyces TaxID=2593676 RepID=UPI0033ADBF5E
MYPTLLNTPGLSRFAHAIDRERQTQLAKFGDQHHRDGTGPDRVWSFTGPASFVASTAREAVEQLAAEGDGYVSWLDIALEEFAEAAAESDPARLRAELIQVAAICAAWIYDIDTRPHPMICAHCGKPIPTGTGLNTWHGPIPKPGQPDYTVPRYHLGTDYPDCRNAGNDTP